jgi:hypothetical protein
MASQCDYITKLKKKPIGPIDPQFQCLKFRKLQNIIFFKKNVNHKMQNLWYIYIYIYKHTTNYFPLSIPILRRMGASDPGQVRWAPQVLGSGQVIFYLLGFLEDLWWICLSLIWGCSQPRFLLHVHVLSVTPFCLSVCVCLSLSLLFVSHHNFSVLLVGKPILQAKWSGEKFYHLWNIPQKIPFDWPHLW